MKGLSAACIAGMFYSLLFFPTGMHGQEAIGLGTDAPNSDAILDIVSTDRGILIPRMSTADRVANLGALGLGDEGMLIYNTTDSEFNYWDGTQWLTFPAAATGDADWHIGLGAIPPTNITDNIWTNGNVGIGMNNPIYRLDVAGDLRLDDGAGGHDIIGGPTGSIFLRSNAGVVIDLEEDGGTTQYFRVRNSLDEILFRVDHNGTTTVDGDLYLENTPGTSSGGDLISFEGGDPVDIVLNTVNSSASLDIESQGTIDMVLDRDNDNAASEFRIKRNGDGTAAVNTLFIVPEDDAPYVYPYGTNTGETGGIKFRELAAGGTNFVRLRAPDAIGTNFALTLPTTDGNANEVLQTDGTGILSWVDPASFADDDWTGAGTGVMYPTTLTDNVAIGTTVSQATLDVSRTYTTGTRGIRNYAEGNVTGGVMHGLHNILNMSGTVGQEAVYNQMIGTSSGSMSGVYNYYVTSSNSTLNGVFNNFQSHGSTASLYGFSNTFQSDAASLYGLNNTFLGGSTITGEVRGVNNSINSQGNSVRHGVYNAIGGTGTGSKYGVSNLISGTANSARTGVDNQVSGSNTGTNTGMRNLFTVTGSGTQYGLHNQFSGASTGALYGARTEISNTGGGSHTGYYANLSGSGAGNKIGLQALINNAAGGTHYGVYSEALKVGSYAGFFLGNVYVGTTGANGYQLPPTDGTATYVMQTDGAGQASWVDPATLSSPDDDWTRNAGDMYPTNLTDDVGIGTNTPGARLHVDGSTIPFLLDVSSTNVLRWNNRRLEWLNSGFSVFIGQNAGQNDDLTNNTNVFIGDFSGDANTNGAANVAIGYNTFSTNTTGGANVAVGANALSVSTGAGNTAVGGSSMVSNTSGTLNVAVGRSTMQNNTTGSNNVALGVSALSANTAGNDNVAIGYFTLISNTASENIGIGIRALGSNTSGTRLTAVGVEALNGNTTASDNLAIGYHALRQNSTGTNHIAIGSFALDANTTGANNIAIGNNALTANVTGNGSIAIGTSALASSNSPGGVANIAIGSLAMTSTTTGTTNVAIGANSLTGNTTGSGSVAAGYNTLVSNTTGFSNVALGSNAMQANTTGTYNVALGFETLDANTTANYNTAIGTQALSANTIGFTNTAVGAQALLSNTIADGNVAMGYLALTSNTTAEYNVAVGYLALNSQSYANGGATWIPGNVAVGYASQAATNSTGAFTGTRNTSVGHETLRANTIGQENTAIGFRSQYVATTGGRNTSVGYAAAADLTVGSYNTAIGSDAMNNNTSGENNTAVGYQALFTQAFANSGTPWDSDNTAVGYQALYSASPTNLNNGYRNSALGAYASYSNVRGAGNVAIGWEALRSNADNWYNVAVGYRALATSTAAQNVAIGGEALAASTTGSGNAAVGYQALTSQTTGVNNTAVGYQAGSNNNVSGCVYLGYNAGQFNAASSRLFIDNTNTLTPLIFGDFTQNRVGINCNAPSSTLHVGGDIRASVAINTTALACSDKRWKKNITDLGPGLHQILALRPVYYEWRSEEFPDEHFDAGCQTGFIAQEMEQVIPELVHELEDGYKAIDYVKLTPYLVSAIQEQQAVIANQEAELEGYRYTVEQQQQTIDAILERLKALEGETARR